MSSEKTLVRLWGATLLGFQFESFTKSNRLTPKELPQHFITVGYQFSRNNNYYLSSVIDNLLKETADEILKTHNLTPDQLYGMKSFNQRTQLSNNNSVEFDFEGNLPFVLDQLDKLIKKAHSKLSEEDQKTLPDSSYGYGIARKVALPPVEQQLKEPEPFQIVYNLCEVYLTEKGKDDWTRYEADSKITSNGSVVVSFWLDELHVYLEGKKKGDRIELTATGMDSTAYMDIISKNQISTIRMVGTWEVFSKECEIEIVMRNGIKQDIDSE